MTTATIAIIEDEFLVALQLEDILLDEGHDVVAIVPDVASVPEIRRAPDVALVDLNLRDGLTGPSIARQLSAKYGTRIIYITANAGQIGVPADRAVGVVHKPFSSDTIEKAVAYALDDTLGMARPAGLQPLTEFELFQSA